MRRSDDWHGLETELAGGKQPPVARNHVACVVYQDRVQPSEFDDRSRDLSHLVVAVRAGVARIGDYSVERPMLDRFGQAGWHLRVYD
jgi:hypothetical protein